MRNRPALFAKFCSAILLCAVAPSQAGEDRETARLIASYNQSGLDIYRRLAEAPGNVAISPLGIGTVMAMALAGARGETRDEMARALGHQVSEDDVDRANAGLLSRLQQRSSKGGVKILSANALHLARSGEKVSDAYRQRLAAAYGAELFGGADLAGINDWARRKTEGKIEEILKQLDPNALCVLVNAIYFNGKWAARFDAKKTQPGDFHLTGSETITVPTMQRRAAYRIVRAADFDAVALPYEGEALALMILLPSREAGLGRLEGGLDAEAVKRVIGELKGASVQEALLSLPKFTIRFDADLTSAFKALGMQRPFDADRADFGGIVESVDGRERIHISQIRHASVLQVNEEGTEAAGGSAVELSQRSMRPAPTPFQVDRPFLYLVADVATGLILFVGRVADPRAG